MHELAMTKERELGPSLLLGLLVDFRGLLGLGLVIGFGPDPQAVFRCGVHEGSRLRGMRAGQARHVLDLLFARLPEGQSQHTRYSDSGRACENMLGVAIHSASVIIGRASIRSC